PAGPRRELQAVNELPGRRHDGVSERVQVRTACRHLALPPDNWRSAAVAQQAHLEFRRAQADATTVVRWRALGGYQHAIVGMRGQDLRARSRPHEQGTALVQAGLGEPLAAVDGTDP